MHRQIKITTRTNIFNILSIKFYSQITLLIIKKFTIMTTKQFFNLPISCGLTRNQLSEIYDALYESAQAKRKKGYYNLADDNYKLMDYIKNITDKIDELSNN